ncbi:hypothetical protein C2E23DRAFT_866640 [Lenzites betulinus]|nr:hypothetical protein C2E23DRAFT_866640 [Lenzites betulinus]
MDKKPVEEGVRTTQVLDIEDEEDRQERMQSLFARLNASPSGPNAGTSAATRPLDFAGRSALPTGTPSELLSRVQAFLPELAASNADLIQRARENPESVNIENIGADQERYIEMKLGLGVFDHRGELPAGIPVANVDLDVQMNDSDSSSDSDSDTTSSDSSTSSSSADDSSSDEESESDVDIVVSAQDNNARPKKPLPKRTTNVEGKRPAITVLSETVEDPPCPK